jgi:anti-sigma B factor antagonist
MEIKTRVEGSIAVAQLSGRFDAHEAPPVAAWLEQVSTRPPARVVVNLAQVTFIDSTALSSLVKGMKQCHQNGGNLVVCGLQSNVKVIFELTRLDRAFSIVATEEEALRAWA